LAFERSQERYMALQGQLAEATAQLQVASRGMLLARHELTEAARGQELEALEADAWRKRYEEAERAAVEERHAAVARALRMAGKVV
jgi:hypothetical protein